LPPLGPATEVQRHPLTPGSALSTLPGNTNKFNEIVKQVQVALLAYGYFNSEITGTVGPKTREAISRLQSDYGLKVTGTITPETLDALRIQAK
jgi:His-Xaa-Ser repeat protein HxsA